MRIAISSTVCAVAALSFAGPAGAAEIYRWTDDDGVVHYSDEMPRDDTVVTTIEIADTRPADYDPLTDPYSIRNQARRMNESWTALEEARAEREAARREAALSEPAPPYYYPPPDYDYYEQPWYYRRGYYARGWLPHPAPHYPPGYRPGPGRRQLQSINTLDLWGPRPASINSGEHYQRVQRSTLLPIVNVARPPAR